MPNLKKQAMITLVLVVSLAGAGYTDTVSMRTLADDLGATFEWDPFRRVGMLWLGTDVVSIQPDLDVVLYNLTEVVPIDPIAYVSGALQVSRQGAEKLRSLLSAGELDGRRIGAIFIDPGHGGKDPGAIGAADGGTVQEKDVVLSVSAALHDLLEATYPGKEILLSRDDDTYITLEGRTEMANAVDLAENESILFISIHANASFNRRAEGYEVWYLPSEYRRTILDVTAVGNENRDILPILNTLKEEEITVDSVLLARGILAGLDASIGAQTENRGLKEESWFVVRNARMPSVLVEVGFLTHREEVERLRDAAYLKRIARGIYNGVVNFVRDFEERG